MKVRTYSSINCNHDFSDHKWDCAYIGSRIDNRTNASIDLVSSRSTTSHLAAFDVSQPDRLIVNSQLTQRSNLKSLMSGAKNVVLDSTSLGTVEILFLIRAAVEAGLDHVDCIYVEPMEYSKDIRIDMSWSREYVLSDSRRLQGVRGFASRLSDIPASDGKFVVFLGYEGARLAQACEQENSFLDWPKYAVFGVPGYAPGWEMNAMANNIDCISQNNFKTVRYCAASSVSNAYDLLTDIHREGRNDNSHTVVAPLGTKPHGIASAMFLVQESAYQASSLLYDHPDKSVNRSTEVRKWHLYRIFLND